MNKYFLICSSVTQLFYNISPLKQENAKREKWKIKQKPNKHETNKIFFPSDCANHEKIIKSLYSIPVNYLHHIYHIYYIYTIYTIRISYIYINNFCIYKLFYI